MEKKFKVLLITIFVFNISHTIRAQNPIVPAGVYIADPSSHVWADGRLYLYGSLDESTDYYCSYRHHVLSTSDLKDWTITKNVFASRGENDQVPYSDALLFAPDCMFKDGTYFMYFCQPDRNAAEGVATSNSPTGPFINGKKIELGGIEEIDPAVFIDDDGQAYYMWGQFQAKIAKLKANMTEIDTSTITIIADENEHFFHEGGYMVKRKGIYYFVYADMSRANRPTSIGYATSTSPMGPFTYGGVIVDNAHCDPSTWNNHGSIVEFKGQWYVFYHRATHNSRMMRKACVEPIWFNSDGSIDEVEMTSQGAGPALNAFDKIDAERACLLFGNTRIVKCAQANEELAEIRNSDNAAYKYVDFKKGATKVKMQVKPLSGGGSISVHIDQPWGPKIGVLAVPGNTKNNWQIITADIKETEGKHALWLRFNGNSEKMYTLDWIKFE
ncbi:family 43 glycosylhydrolase [uncultured Draconibacterium sp.]|uniref:family 43 glycosylhydrolase n=1 Tax=uncultured Draconibacterium sp. TaxID=1573823 RepID=UPI0029C703C5|nr:family 43 glycosylhydrolase [uncultured Draconibacterium sp.]